MSKQSCDTQHFAADNGVQKKELTNTSIREGQLQILIECVPDMIARIGMDGRVIYASPSSMNLLGFSSAQLLDKNLYDLMPDADSVRVKGLMERVAVAGEMAICEYRLRRADGKLIWVEMRSQLAQCNGGNEMVAVLRDISECHRKELENDERCLCLERQLRKQNSHREITVEQLRKQMGEHVRDRAALDASEIRYTTLVENTLTGIYIHDGQKLVYCNERFARIFGFERDTLEDIDINNLFVRSIPADEPHPAMKQAEVVEGMTCDRKRIWLKMSRASMVWNGQQLVVGNVIDITDQIVTNERLKQSEQELHALSSQLMVAQEQERKRIANELHDGLGQRLSAIKFSLENVCRTVDNEVHAEQTRRLEVIIGSVRDAIEEVRRVSMDLRPSVLDDLGLIATIGWFCREFSLLFPTVTVHRNINVEERDIPEDVKVVIFRIIQEAFHNISKHAQAGEIAIDLQIYDNLLRLTIRDNGRGISCIDHSPCTQGLGLKSMRERAELTHGEFHVDSVEGMGTTITVQWPLARN